MPEYEFKCGDCQHCFSLAQSMKAPRPKSCPRCRCRKNFGQVIGLPIGVRGEPRTVGSLAEKNTKKLCKEEYDAVMMKGKIKGLSPQMKKRVEAAGGTVVEPKKRSGELPWYRDGSIPGVERSEKPIDITKIKDVKKFIATGKKN